MVELIDSYIRRDGIKEDTDFFVKELATAMAALERLDKAKVDLKAAKSFTQAGEAAGKMRTELTALEKAEQQLTKITEQRKAASADVVKQLAAEKEALRLQNQEIKNTVREQRAAEGSIEQLRAALIRLNKEYDNLSATDRQTDTGQGLKTQIKGISDELKKLEGDTGRFQRNVGNYSGAVKTLEKALGDVRNKLDQYNQSGKVSAETIEALAREEALLSQLVNAQINGFANATQELRKNEQALQALGAAGLQQTEFYQELLQQTAELKDNVGDLKEEIKNLSSDTGTLDGLIQGAETLTGLYSVAQGAAALFGDENEELQKTFVKLQAAMTILNGLQAIRNALQSQSSLMLLLEKGRTLGLAAAQGVLSFATGGATLALKAFRTAMLLTGVGAAVVLLTAAAEAMGLMGDETEDTTDSIKDQQKAIEEYNKAAEEFIDKSERQRNARKGGLDDLKRELQLLDAAGASEGKRFETKKQILEKELENIEIRRASIDADGKLDVQLDKEIADKKNEIRAEQLAFDKKMSDESIKLAKERAAKATEYYKTETKAQFELLKLSIEEEIELRKKAVVNPTADLSSRLDARAMQLDKEKELAEAQKNFELQNTKLTESERLLVIQQYKKQVKDLEEQTVDDIIAIRQQVAIKEKEEREKIAAEGKAFQEKQVSNDIAAAERSLEGRLSYLADIAQADAEIAFEAYKRGELSKEQYEKRKLEIENEYRRKSLLAEIEFNQKLLMVANLAPEEKAEAQRRLAELERQLRAQGLEEEKRATEESIEIHKKRNEKLKELGEELKETAFAFITAGIDREKNAVQEQIDLLEQRKQKEIETANQAITSTEERANAIAIIEARATAQKEQLERRKRTLDEQRARYERLKNITDIIQSTAIAVVTTLGAKPWTPANIALAAIVGAIGAAQIARVLATPIPKFKDGKFDDYEGPAIVGDGGKPEAILREDGSIEITPDKPTYTYIGAKDIVLPDAKELAEQQFRMAINATGKLVQGYNPKQPDSRQVEKAINQLGNRFEHAIKNIPQPHITTPNPIREWSRGNDSWRRL